MIRIISRDAVFSRMLSVLFSGEETVMVSARAADAKKEGFCLWDAESMGDPDINDHSALVVLTFDDKADPSLKFPCVVRPFKLDDFKKYVLDLVRSGGMMRQICFDDETTSVSSEGVTVKFSPAEYLLLRKFYDAAGQLVSKEEALSVFESEESNVLEVYVYYLRQKLKKLPRHPEITTVRGKGYILKKGELN